MHLTPGMIVYFRSVAVRVLEVQGTRAKIIRASRTARTSVFRFGQWVAISRLRSEHSKQMRSRMIRAACKEAQKPEPMPTKDFLPTTALPGSPEKLEVLAERLKKSLPLWHEQDVIFDFTIQSIVDAMKNESR